MGVEKAFPCIFDINVSIFGCTGFDHPKRLNFSFSKTSATLEVSGQVSLLLARAILGPFPSPVLKGFLSYGEISCQNLNEITNLCYSLIETTRCSRLLINLGRSNS